MSAHGLLIIDKAAGPTSHDVVARARRALGTRDVGHAGTLDPAATGVLVLGVGEGLKALRYLQLDDKRYDATLELGVETDTLDAEGRVVGREPVPELDPAALTATAAAFLGEREQTPPAFSARKQDGVPHYVRARRGEAVEPAARAVVLHAIDVRAVRGATVELSLHCGSGFYVRSLARDLARALGTVGHLTALRRTQSGAYRANDALDYEVLAAAARGEQDARTRAMAAVVPLAAALAHVPSATLDEAGAAHARHGRLIPAEHVQSGAALPPPGTEPVLLFWAGEPIALARVDADGIRVVRGLRLS